MSAQTEEHSEKPEEQTVKVHAKETIGGSAVINEILFKAIRVYTTCTPYVVRSPCFSSLAVNESATNLASCLSELDFLKEQCVSALKPHSATVVYDLLQSGMLPEEAIMALQDDEGTYLISELIEDQIGDENSEEVEDEGVEETEQESVTESNKELDMALMCDKIKLASARMIVDAIYKEAATTVQVALTKGKSPWLDKVRTTLDLNSVLDVQGWLEKLTDCVRNLENYPINEITCAVADLGRGHKFIINTLPAQKLMWKRLLEWTLDDVREVRLTTFEIWSEINATLTDNLQVNDGLLDELVRHHIINEHIKSRLSTLPNRKAKVKYLLNYLLDMGSSVMFTFGSILTSIGQKSLGRIVIKRLKDNKIPTNLL